MRSRIEVTLRGGATLTREAGTYRGGPEQPLTREELYGKFRDCASLVMDDAASTRALELLERVEELQTIAELIETLTPHATGPAVAGPAASA